MTNELSNPKDAYCYAKDIVKKGIELAVLLNKEKVKSELNQLFELYFD